MGKAETQTRKESKPALRGFTYPHCSGETCMTSVAICVKQSKDCERIKGNERHSGGQNREKQWKKIKNSFS